LIKTCATQTKRTHALSELRLKCAEAEIVAILLRPAKILSSCSDKIYTSKNALKSFYNAWISAAQEARTASELRYSTLARNNAAYKKAVEARPLPSPRPALLSCLS